MKILFFGVAKEISGKKEMEISADRCNTTNDLKEFLFEQFPKLGALKSLNFAINEKYAADNQQLNDEDVVALIPPVSGG